MPLLGIALDDDVEEDESIGASWNIDLNGSMIHTPTGVRVGTTSGISAEGQEYRLTADKIEMEDTRLGAGACGAVLKGMIKDSGVPVAVKTIKIDDKQKRDQLLREIKGLMEAERCQYLVNWYGGFVARAASTVHIVLEFMDGGSLRELIRLAPRGMDPAFVATATFQVLKGLEFLHGTMRVLHRDVKPENILLSGKASVVKLADFGISKPLSAAEGALDMAGTFTGTTTYMSPERVLGEDYDFASDVWSAAVVLYEMASGKYPFGDVRSFPALFEALIDKPEPRLERQEGHSAELCDLVSKCLVRDVAKRADTCALLRHPFLACGSQPKNSGAALAAPAKDGSRALQPPGAMPRTWGSLQAELKVLTEALQSIKSVRAKQEEFLQQLRGT